MKKFGDVREWRPAVFLMLKNALPTTDDVPYLMKTVADADKLSLLTTPMQESKVFKLSKKPKTPINKEKPAKAVPKGGKSGKMGMGRKKAQAVKEPQKKDINQQMDEEGQLNHMTDSLTMAGVSTLRKRVFGALELEFFALCAAQRPSFMRMHFLHAAGVTIKPFSSTGARLIFRDIYNKRVRKCSVEILKTSFLLDGITFATTGEISFAMSEKTRRMPFRCHGAPGSAMRFIRLRYRRPTMFTASPSSTRASGIACRSTLTCHHGHVIG